MIPFSKILQDSQMLLNAKAVLQERLLGEKDRNTFEYLKSARFLYIVSLDTYNNFEMKVLFLQLRTYRVKEVKDFTNLIWCVHVC